MSPIVLLQILSVRLLPVAGLMLLLGVPASAQVSVTTQHNDTARTGANLGETVLNTSNVNVSQFGKLFTRTVDDQIYGQPLYVPNVAIPGVGTRNVIYVATVNDSVYAFDADSPTASAPLWQVSFINPAAGIVPISRTEVGQSCGTYNDFSGNIGIVGTPVIDTASQTIYLVARTKENGTYVQRLRALDIRTGAERAGSPVLIQASVNGIGDGNVGGVVSFNARTHNQRPGLLLANNVVYIAWASHCDTGPYHGWVIGYNTATLQQVFVYNTSANGGLAGIWQSGQAPAADASGNIYVLTGNGTFDGQSGGSNFGNSFLKISPSGALLDWFTPYNFGFLNSIDADLGSLGAMLVPNTNLVIGGGKQGVLYVLDRNNMGHFRSGSDTQIVQSFQASSGGFLNGSPVYWNSPNNGPVIYLWADGDPLKAFRFTGGLFQTTPAMQSTMNSPGMPGGMLSLSANGSAAGTGIVWAAVPLSGSANQNVRPGILRAFDATDITRELWNSELNATRDAVGNFAKFSYPTIANGKVYLATFSNKLVAYGVLGGTGGNRAPTVNAGGDQTITLPSSASLSGTASDDGLPNPPATLTTTWSKVSGPGTVTFANASARATTASFSAAGSYVLRLTASDSALSASDDVAITVNSSSGGGGGTGLTGQYYNDAGTGTYFTNLALTRTDATVNFEWGGSPSAGVQADNFSVRWTGQVLANVSGSYTFSTLSDDGVRLWVNGQLLIDNWTDHGPTTNTAAPISLTGGTRYDVKMEFYEHTSGAAAKLLWSYPGQIQQVIPQGQLFAVNRAPTVNAGPDQTITLPTVVNLSGSASDDGLPNPPAALTTSWRKVSGREDGDGGQVVFGNPNALTTTATFSGSGTYVLRLTANDGALSSSDDITIVVNGTGGGTANGLSATYYDNINFTGTSVSRVDPTVNFTWGTGSPAPGIGADTFSVRWTGQVLAPNTGTYTFYTRSDDGVRLWVNGQQLVNNWTDHAATENSGTIALTGGQRYAITMEYYENGWDAVATLSWSGPSTAKAIIPQSQLFSQVSTGFSAKVNFQPASAPVPAGYVADGGLVYANRGNGYTYGWNADNTAAARDRNAPNSPDQRYDTLNHLQKSPNSNAVWEIAVANGTYRVRVVAGDASHFDSVFKMNVEGVLALNATPTSSTPWVEATVTVTVTDGRLTIGNASGASNNKINFVEITAQ
jgi:hypothetical protein